MINIKKIKNQGTNKRRYNIIDDWAHGKLNNTEKPIYAKYYVAGEEVSWKNIPVGQEVETAILTPTQIVGNDLINSLAYYISLKINKDGTQSVILDKNSEVLTVDNKPIKIGSYKGPIEIPVISIVPRSLMMQTIVKTGDTPGQINYKDASEQQTGTYFLITTEMEKEETENLFRTPTDRGIYKSNWYFPTFNASDRTSSYGKNTMEEIGGGKVRTNFLLKVNPSKVGGYGVNKKFQNDSDPNAPYNEYNKYLFSMTQED